MGGARRSRGRRSECQFGGFLNGANDATAVLRTFLDACNRRPTCSTRRAGSLTDGRSIWLVGADRHRYSPCQVSAIIVSLSA